MLETAHKYMMTMGIHMEPVDTVLLCHQSTSMISLSEGTLRLMSVCTRAGTNTPSDEYDTYRDTGWRIRYVSRIHFFSEAKLGNG